MSHHLSVKTFYQRRRAPASEKLEILMPRQEFYFMLARSLTNAYIIYVRIILVVYSLHRHHYRTVLKLHSRRSMKSKMLFYFSSLQGRRTCDRFVSFYAATSPLILAHRVKCRADSKLFSLVEIKTITAQFLRLPSSPSFAELVKSPEFLLHPEKFPRLQVNISYQPSSIPFQGAFKIAHYGHTDIPLFGSSTQVCIKQTFCMSTENKRLIFQGQTQAANLSIDSELKHLIFQGQTQAANLSTEVNCLGWASALMDVVYCFMKKEDSVRGSPPFEVPQMRYVQAGLAIQVSKDLEGTDKQNVYLLEEFIDSEDPGWFVKYLNNNSAKPFKFKDKERSIRAEFLSFCQHVQFIETGEQAFLSDLQGKSLTRRSLNSDQLTFQYFRWTLLAH